MNPLLILVAPFFGAFVSYFVGRKNESLRDLFNILLNAGVLIGVLTLAPALKTGSITVNVPQLMGTGLDISIGPLQYLLVLLTSVIWLLTTMFLTQYIPSRQNRNRFHFFFLLTYGSTLGFFMTNNILNQFTFFEVLSLSGYFLIIHDEDSDAHSAGGLYLPMAISGGLCALLGILTAYEATGSLMISDISHLLAFNTTEKYIVGGLLFLGYAVKAGIFPLHIWVPKAYTAAPAPATAILTGVLAKTGLYGLYSTVVIITGNDPIFGWLAVVLGFITLLHGGVLALLQQNTKRILAYSSLSQYGLILLGIGIGSLSGVEGTLALAGAFIHMVSHGLFKVLLFLIVGLLYLRTQELDLNLIRGIGKRNRLLLVTVVISILSAWGIPGFTGSVSKSLLHEGLALWAHSLPHWGALVAETLFTLGSGLTVAYFTKLGMALFVDPPTEFAEMIWLKRRKRAAIPMVLLALLILATGLYPGPMEDLVRSGLALHGASLAHAEHAQPSSPISVALPLVLGLLIHLFFTRRHLRKNTEGNIQYLNPLQNGFSLETHLFVPLAKATFQRMTALSAIADSGLVKSASLISKGLQSIDKFFLPADSASDMTTAPLAQDVSPARSIKKDPLLVRKSHHPSANKPKPKTLKHSKHSFTDWDLKISPSPFRKYLEGTAGLTFALYLFGAFLVSMIFVLIIY